jgi:hypothetical protein
MFSIGKTQELQTLFWKNYFFHCERIRALRLQQRGKKANPTSAVAGHHEFTNAERPSVHKLPLPSSFGIPVVEHNGAAGIITSAAARERSLHREISSLGGDDIDDDDDDGSLLTAASDAEAADDSSYVIASAPNSVTTFATTRSLGDDIIMVNSLDIQGNKSNKSRTTGSGL